jgi:hypothetical protein
MRIINHRHQWLMHEACQISNGIKDSEIRTLASNQVIFPLRIRSKDRPSQSID